MIGVPGDVHEREAEKIAAGVMRPAESHPQAAHPEDPGSRQVPRLDSAGGGQPLPDSARTFFEPRFHADFGAIRIHRDDEAERSAAGIGARAFTSGRDIVFGAGQYRPETPAGRRLLAHELVHTLQQDRSPSRHPSIATPAATPTLQRSAKARFDKAGHEEKASILRGEFEETLYAKGRRRERKKRRFEKQLGRLDPERHAQKEAELEAKFSERPGRLKRKRKQLERRQRRAEKKVGKLPDLGFVLVISANYHYVKSHQLPNGQVYTFPDSALEATKKKFRAGKIWRDIPWGGRGGINIGVRFEIDFTPHKTMAEVESISGETPGDVPMVGGPLAAAASSVKTYDYTQEPPVTPPSGKNTLGQAAYQGVEIDTEAMRRERFDVTYYRRESDRAVGKAPEHEVRRPDPQELDRYMASVIAHEIGHNIGMIHRDVDIMSDQRSTVAHTRTKVPDVSPSGSGTDIVTQIRMSYPDNPVTRENVKLLVDRIPEMTQKKRLYWTEAIPDFTGPGDLPSPDTGFTILKGAGPGDPGPEAAGE